MASNISEIFNHFFTRKSSGKKKSEEVVKEEFNNQTFYRSKSGRYRSINKKRSKLSDDTYLPANSPALGETSQTSISLGADLTATNPT